MRSASDARPFEWWGFGGVVRGANEGDTVQFHRVAAFVIAFLCLGVLSSARLSAQNRTLNDTFTGKWKVTMSPDEAAAKAGEKEFADTLVFTGDKFVAEACKKYGFDAVTYDSDTRRFGPATFTAEPKSEKEGKAKWTGTVTGSSISGEMTWTKKDGTELHYSYKGERAS